jgi:2-hydroxychromene-2-carboxylate isomerase
MPPSTLIDYYFTLQSPWAYIGHAVFLAVARRHGAGIRYRPMALGQIFPNSGGLPLAQRHPLRQRYRMLELQRWRERRGLDFHLHPAFWPFDAGLADRSILALVERGLDPEPYLGLAYAAVWEEQRDLADPSVLSALLARAGHAPEAFLNAALSEALIDTYAANSQAALEAGVFGSPAYVRQGEVFWGQDRIELLDAALASGRPPFTAA